MRLVNQQLARPRFRKPEDLVAWFGAVQAQDYPGASWAVGQRLPASVDADVEAAIASRAIVRTWPMRETLHFVAAADVRWMLALLAPRLLSRNAGRYRQLELDASALTRSRKVLTRALAGGACLTRAEAYAALQRAGVSPAGQRGIHIIAHLAQSGVVCFGSREGKQPTFVLLEDWIAPAPEVSRTEALARLAIAYFRSHGPATFRDFAWWAGLLARDATAAVAEAGSALVRETQGGRDFWISPGGASRRPPPPAAALLPPWDEYLVAYKDRDHALGHLREVPPMVIGRPLLVIDGRVRGDWSRAVEPSRVTVTVRVWSRATERERGMIEDAVERYGRFVGRTPVTVIRTGARTRP
jgi:hypothetical protein